MNRLTWGFVLIAMGISTTVAAADRAEYNRRSVERYTEMFRMSDANADNVVTLYEARTTIELAANFNDIDIDRDGSITWAELTRYIDATFR